MCAIIRGPYGGPQTESRVPRTPHLPRPHRLKLPSLTKTAPCSKGAFLLAILADLQPCSQPGPAAVLEPLVELR